MSAEVDFQSGDLVMYTGKKHEFFVAGTVAKPKGHYDHIEGVLVYVHPTYGTGSIDADPSELTRIYAEDASGHLIEDARERLDQWNAECDASPRITMG